MWDNPHHDINVLGTNSTGEGSVWGNDAMYNGAVSRDV